MQLLPSKRIILRSPLTKEQVFEIISNNISSPVVNSSHGATENFLGIAWSEGFEIQPVIKHGRNSFNPIISGSLAGLETGAEIIITLKLHKFVQLFMTIWLSMCGFACLGVFLGKY